MNCFAPSVWNLHSLVSESIISNMTNSIMQASNASWFDELLSASPAERSPRAFCLASKASRYASDADDSDATVSVCCAFSVAAPLLRREFAKCNAAFATMMCCNIGCCSESDNRPRNGLPVGESSSTRSLHTLVSSRRQSAWSFAHIETHNI